MINTSKQKRIIDITFKKGRGYLYFDRNETTQVLTMRSSNFMDAVVSGDGIKAIFEYTAYIFKLRQAQALFLDEVYAGTTNYNIDSTLINNATNQGFLMLEILSKVMPVGDLDMDIAMEYVIRYFNEEITRDKTLDYIQELIYGNAKDKL